MKVIYVIIFWVMVLLIILSKLYVIMERRGSSGLAIPNWISWTFIGIVALQIISNLWDWKMGKETRWPVVYKKDLVDIELNKVLKQVVQSNKSVTITDNLKNNQPSRKMLSARKLINKILVMSGLDPLYYKEDKQGAFEVRLTIAGVKKLYSFKINYSCNDSSISIFPK